MLGLWFEILISSISLSLCFSLFVPPSVCPLHEHSGYDFGYLVRLLTNCKLPDKEKEFFELLSIFFPRLYDVKYLMKSCKSLKGGLQEVADSLEVGYHPRTF